MVRSYQRKTRRQLTDPTKLKKAVDLIEKGWALRAAAREQNISRSSVFDFMEKFKQKGIEASEAPKSMFKLSHASRSVFSSDQEDSIVSYCLQVSGMGYGLTVEKVRQLAWGVAEKNDIKVPANWERDELASIDWFQGFKKRHSNKLSIRTPEACSIARAMAFNKPNVVKYFEKLEEVLKRHPSFQDGSRTYNLDETSTSTVQNMRKVVSAKGVKQVHQVKTAERGTSITTSMIIGAHGLILPPVMIFPRKIFESNMLINCFPGTLGLANEKGYNTKETFVEVMKHFIKCTCSSKENPTLLLLDDVGSHFSSESLDLAEENGVVILTFPPYCTHKLQPLDAGFFGPFKTYYDHAIQSFILNNPGIQITIYHLAGFVREAMSKVASPNTIMASFEKPGIYPFNPDVWQDSDFIMASVSEQPPPTCGTLEDSLAITSVQQNQAFGNNKKTVKLCDKNDHDENIAGEDKDGSSSFISPQMIKGLPHVKVRNLTRKPKRKGKSMVATDTPEKQAIEEQEREVREKKKKIEERREKRNPTKTDKDTIQKREGRDPIRLQRP